jgi:hypothetical protein
MAERLGVSAPRLPDQKERHYRYHGGDDVNLCINAPTDENVVS